MKKCTKCKVVKPLDCYPQDKRASDGKASSCKECNNANFRKRYATKEYKKSHAAYRRLKRYGITNEQYEQRLKDCNNSCEICGVSFTTAKLHVDHCHETGKFRGLLCSCCNTALGGLGDNIEGLMRAINYLRNT